MGKKVKKRIDTFFKRAKIAGYRARSAYKLLQIEKKFQILQGSRVCIDLCAAPGSWMQVAKQTMPLSSIIIGVDLYPIKSIQGTISIRGDITTDKLRKELKGKLTTWKADVVLHDGSPKVGQNWLHDAYQQNLLVLSAFKLACELLRKGGSFVTKVFRSKDYFKLEYVFRKLFKTVNATKPISSRYESAEIFVVCLGYLAPNKVDQEFFDPKSVFEEVDQEPINKINLWKPRKKVKAEGYPEGATTLYNKVAVSEFVHATNYVELLQTASELHFEKDESFKNHKLTNDNIIENCKDIKVLGRKELKQLLNWRKAIKKDLDNIMQEKEKLQKKDKADTEDSSEKQEAKNDTDEIDEELAALEKEIEEIKSEQARSTKKKEKKSLKMKRKLMEKMKLKSLVPGDCGPTDTSREIFSLERLSKLQDIDAVLDQDASQVLSESEEEEKGERKEYVVYTKDKQRLDRTGRFWMNPHDKEIDVREEIDDEKEIAKESLSFKEDRNTVDLDDAPGSDKEDADEVINPLLTDLVGDTRDARRARKANTWFNQDIFQDLEKEDEEDFEIDNTIKIFENQGGIIPKKIPKQQGKKTQDEGYTSDHSEEEVARDAPEGYTDSESDSDSDTDSDDESEKKRSSKLVLGAGGAALTNATRNKKRKVEEGLGALGLSLATQMIHSKKAKRDIMDAGWNRYMYGDADDLPYWFVADEKRFNQIRIEVEPSDLRMYRDRGKNVNAQTIKKVVEAKARKQRRVKNRMEKAKKKAEVITNNAELSQKEKAEEVNKLYKKAQAPLKKKEAQYVVMKKRNQGKKPKGMKGPYKMVDKRLKKDKKAMKRAETKKGKHAKPPKARPQRKKRKV